MVCVHSNNDQDMPAVPVTHSRLVRKAIHTWGEQQLGMKHRIDPFDDRIAASAPTGCEDRHQLKRIVKKDWKDTCQLRLCFRDAETADQYSHVTPLLRTWPVSRHNCAN